MAARRIHIREEKSVVEGIRDELGHMFVREVDGMLAAVQKGTIIGGITVPLGREPAVKAHSDIP